MNYRTLGKTHLQVSELGYGAWGIGKSMWLGAQDDESLAALRRAIDGGVNFLDTALVYGDGHSESLVGRAVRDSSETVYVASKVPPANWNWPASGQAQAAYPGKWVVECTERSLSNLGLETIDVQQFHVWSDSWLGQGDWAEAVQQLKLDGKIRFFGVSINDHEPANAVELVRSGIVDSVQVIYNIFDQSPEDELFAAVLEHNVGVVVRVPFDEGSLAGRVTPETEFPEGDFRNGYFGGDRRKQVWDHVQALVEDLGISVAQLPEIALRYTLSHPAVSTVIPGMRSMRSVEANLEAEAKGHLSEPELEILRRHRWIRNFYDALQE